jgi:uncharacterized protein
MNRALLLGLGILVSGCGHMHRHHGGPPMVTATGQGKVAGTPDQATVTVAAISEAKDAETAAAQSAAVQTQIVDAAKAIVGSEGSVKTTSYSLNPVYDFTDNKQILRGYQVRNAITVELWNTKSVGPLIDATVKAGASEVNSIAFGLRDGTALRQQAIAAASQAALREATAAAQGLGMKVGDVRTVAVGSASGSVPMPMEKFSRMAAVADATPVEAGTVDTTATVSIEVQLVKP